VTSYLLLEPYLGVVQGLAVGQHLLGHVRRPPRRAAVFALQRLQPPGSPMTKCVKPLRHLERISTKSSRSTNQNAPFGRLSTTCCDLRKCLSGFTHFVIPLDPSSETIHRVSAA